MPGGGVPMWLWLVVVIAGVLVSIAIARDGGEHCATCGRRLPARTRITERYSDGRSEVCLDCFMETFR